MTHLVLSISGHGFGHVAQTAPVLNALHQMMPQLRLTVRSAVPLAHLRSRIHVPFAHLPGEGDIGMAMSSALETLPNLVPVAPIAAVGSNRRDELNHQLKLAKEERLVLVSLGGIAGRLPIERWPRIDGVRWLVQQNWQVEHPDAIALESVPMSFSDLLASSDALICKPGYGSFAEAACSGTPVLYVSRADWPESPALIEWLQRHGLCREISRNALEQGNFADALEEIRYAPRPKPVIPEGAGQVANWIAERLQR